MSEYDYKVIAAPTKGVKAKGLKSTEDRFANAIELTINEMASQGWEYQRAEALPSVERSGLTSSKTVWHNLLVFRKAKPTPAAAEAPARTTPVVADPPLTAQPKAEEPQAPEIVSPQTPEDDASKSEGATRMLKDNGVEELSEVSGVTNSLKTLAQSRNASKTDD
jgi:hypothetical protein